MEQVQQNKMGTAPMFKLILSMSLPAMFFDAHSIAVQRCGQLFCRKISENCLYRCIHCGTGSAFDAV